MHPETNVSIMVRVHNPLELSTPSLMVLRRNEVTGLLHVLNVVKSIKVYVMNAPEVVSSVLRLGISCENVQRTSKEMVPVEEQTAYVLSTVAKSKRIFQMFSLV